MIKTITLERGTPVPEAIEIDATGVHYKDLNDRLREAVAQGVKRVDILNVSGQRYIGTSLRQPIEVHLHGTPGNDLCAFMNGSRVVVHGNAQDGCGNTMNAGELIVHGRAGDITGYSMRGGKLFVRDDVGYRVGIHMKEYLDQRPSVIIGGTAQPFLGEYMAGGRLVVLGLNLQPGERHRATFIGTGMHGGVIYLRGEVDAYQLGKEVGVVPLDEKDFALLRGLVGEFTAHFGGDPDAIMQVPFLKLIPLSLRPYGRLYAY